MNRNLPSDKKAVYYDANGNKCKKIDFIRNCATGKIVDKISGTEFIVKNGFVDMAEIDLIKDNPLYIKMQNGATREEVRNYNYKQTYEKLSKLWKNPKNQPTKVYEYIRDNNININKLTPKTIETMFEKGNLNITIHECIDGRIMLIDKTIHSRIHHIGAVAYYNQSSAMPEILRDYYGSTVTKTLSVTEQKANYYGGSTNIKGK